MERFGKYKDFDDLQVSEYVDDCIKIYKHEMNELDSCNHSKIFELIFDFINNLENFRKYIKSEKNDGKALDEIFQPQIMHDAKIHDIDDKTLDEIFNYCARNIRILEIIKNRTSEYSNGVYATCKYIKEIIDIAEFEKEGK